MTCLEVCHRFNQNISPLDSTPIHLWRSVSRNEVHGPSLLYPTYLWFQTLPCSSTLIFSLLVDRVQWTFSRFLSLSNCGQENFGQSETGTDKITKFTGYLLYNCHRPYLRYVPGLSYLKLVLWKSMTVTTYWIFVVFKYRNIPWDIVVMSHSNLSENLCSTYDLRKMGSSSSLSRNNLYKLYTRVKKGYKTGRRDTPESKWFQCTL